jgi:acetate kinase
MNILTINAGSSSIKYKVFENVNGVPSAIVAGLIEGIGEKTGHWHHTHHQKNTTSHQFASHQQAFAELAQKLHNNLEDFTIEAVGHRVVHGGSQYFNPTVITENLLQAIIDLTPLAPIHNPVNALGIQFAMDYFPKATHVALFDSGFHHTIPNHIHTYAIDADIASQYQIRRYGFHGINHEYIAHQAALFLKKPLASCNFISLHLGNGASACLVKQGKSFDTSMGMTPLAGLIMGSRCGDIDPAIPIYLQQQGMPLEEVDKLLNKRSGLIGIANENDMRHLLTRLKEGDESAELAIAMYVYSIQKTIGGYLTQTPSLDALIFTGGVGENAAPIREKIITALSHMGFTIDNQQNDGNTGADCRNISANEQPILVIRGDEEHYIAQEVEKLIRAT